MVTPTKHSLILSVAAPSLSQLPVGKRLEVSNCRATCLCRVAQDPSSRGPPLAMRQLDAPGTLRGDMPAPSARVVSEDYQ
jgi:hypothetical protein